MRCHIFGSIIFIVINLVVDVTYAVDRSRDTFDGQQNVAFKNCVELIQMRGFRAEQHEVVTQDGFFIHVVRIIHPDTCSGCRPPKQPVLFNHGLLASATMWLINSRNIRPLTYSEQYNRTKISKHEAKQAQFLNLPMLLANHGYDVWLMNSRGANPSPKHETYSYKTPEYWNYSLDDIGLCDIPTVIDFISKKTKAVKVGYVGFSQGSFGVLALLSKSPEWSNFIDPVVNIAPIAYLSELNSELIDETIQREANATNFEHGPYPNDAKKLRREAFECRKGGIDDYKRPLPAEKSSLCKLFSEVTFNHLPSGFYAHFPFRTSKKVIRHYDQLISSGKFQGYCYGSGNMERYGTDLPPEYPIEHITSRSLIMISGHDDSLVSQADLNKFLDRLKVPLYQNIRFPLSSGMNHLDFVLNSRVKAHINAPILEAFERLAIKS